MSSAKWRPFYRGLNVLKDPSPSGQETGIFKEKYVLAKDLAPYVARVSAATVLTMQFS